MSLVGAIIAANGFTLPSLAALLCGGAIALLPKRSFLNKADSVTNSAGAAPTTAEPTTPEPEPTMTSSGAFRLYRENELNRIVAGLLANGSILVAGEEGSGKSVLVNAVTNRLVNDGFMVARVEPATTKQMLLEIADQLGIETHNLEGKSLTTDHLKTRIASFLKDNTAFLVIDDCHRCDSRFRDWLKTLKSMKVPIAIFATNPPKTDVFQNLGALILQPLPEYAIREIMEQAALSKGLKLKNSDLARLQERAGGNPMLAERAIDEEYLGLEVEGADHNQYVDATPMILVAGICFMVLRFIGRGTDDRTLYLISGIGGVVFMGFSRMFYNLPPDSRRIMR